MAAAAMLENRKKLRYLDKRLPLKPRQHGALRIFVLYCICTKFGMTMQNGSLDRPRSLKYLNFKDPETNDALDTGVV